MKATVLLMTYNHEKYIRKAIESVLMQKDCEPFDIIVCDDCSTDNTDAVAQSLLQNTPNARVFSNEKNIGITRNYQQAFSICSGDYVFVLEGDDYWTDELKIKKQCSLLDEHFRCVSCSHFYYTEKEGAESLLAPLLQKEEAVSFFSANDIILNPFIGNNFSTCCYRRSALERISPATYDVISYEWMINISISKFGDTAVINQPMSVYRVWASGSWSKLSEEEQLRGMIDILPKYNAILDYRFQPAFEKKTEMLKQQLYAIEQRKQTAQHPQKSAGRIKRFLLSFAGRLTNR